MEIVGRAIPQRESRLPISQPVTATFLERSRAYVPKADPLNMTAPGWTPAQRELGGAHFVSSIVIKAIQASLDRD